MEEDTTDEEVSSVRAVVLPTPTVCLSDRLPVIFFVQLEIVEWTAMPYRKQKHARTEVSSARTLLSFARFLCSSLSFARTLDERLRSVPRDPMGDLRADWWRRVRLRELTGMERALIMTPELMDERIAFEEAEREEEERKRKEKERERDL